MNKMQIKNIDLFTRKDEFVEDLRREWRWRRGEVTEDGALGNSGGGGAATRECGS